jgi:hypothetical protein
MKKNILTLVALILPLFFCTSFIRDKCDSEATYTTALTKLKGYKFLKDYRVYLKKKKKEEPIELLYFPVTLNRGEKYRFYCESNPAFSGSLVINVYNNMKREFRVATTYEPTTHVKRESVEFVCNSTGVFCLGFYFLDGAEGCGVGISSFTRE